MKFRYLTNEELELLEEDFVQFLIVNGVEGKKWEKINSENHANALELVGLFSDLVLQKSLEKVDFGEFSNKSQFFIFAFKSEEIELVAVQSSDPQLDISIFENLIESIQNYPTALSIFKQKKIYSRSREEEIFALMNNGLLLSNQKQFDLLNQFV